MVRTAYGAGCLHTCRFILRLSDMLGRTFPKYQKRDTWKEGSCTGKESVMVKSTLKLTDWAGPSYLVEFLKLVLGETFVNFFYQRAQLSACTQRAWKELSGLSTFYSHIYTRMHAHTYINHQKLHLVTSKDRCYCPQSVVLQSLHTRLIPRILSANWGLGTRLLAHTWSIFLKNWQPSAICKTSSKHYCYSIQQFIYSQSRPYYGMAWVSPFGLDSWTKTWLYYYSCCTYLVMALCCLQS